MSFWPVLQTNVWFLSQNEEEVLLMGRMYEPKRGEGKDSDTLGRLLWDTVWQQYFQIHIHIHNFLGKIMLCDYSNNAEQATHYKNICSLFIVHLTT